MWKSLLIELPLNLDLVYIRINNIYGQYATATYNLTDGTFTTVVTGLVVPQIMVSRWKLISHD